MIKILFLCLALACMVHPAQVLAAQEQPSVLIVLGSARDHSVSKKIAHVLTNLVGTSVTHEVVDLKNRPLVDLENPVTSKAIDDWKTQFQQASIVIFLAPNYNGGYTGVLKNGIDALGATAAGKKVALIGYSGGYEAKEPVVALMPTLQTLHMQVIGEPLLIPMADSAFDFEGNIKKTELKDSFTVLISTLVKTITVEK